MGKYEFSMWTLPGVDWNQLEASGIWELYRCIAKKQFKEKSIRIGLTFDHAVVTKAVGNKDMYQSVFWPKYQLSKSYKPVTSYLLENICDIRNINYCKCYTSHLFHNFEDSLHSLLQLVAHCIGKWWDTGWSQVRDSKVASRRRRFPSSVIEDMDWSNTSQHISGHQYFLSVENVWQSGNAISLKATFNAMYSSGIL